MSESESKRIIEFPKGIPGFEEYKHYELIEEEDSLLAQLNSTLNSQAGFILIKAQALFNDYLPKVDFGGEEAALLEIEKEDVVEVWSIVTLCQHDMTRTTVNLRGPIIINTRTSKGAQFILEDDRYSSRQPLFKDLPQSDFHGEVYREGAGR